MTRKPISRRIMKYGHNSKPNGARNDRLSNCVLSRKYNYLIFYEVIDAQQQVRIADIIHSARQSEIERIRGGFPSGSNPLA
jgi:hypothetical protein